MFQEHRKASILTKVARDLDLTVPPATVAGQSNATNLFSRASNWLSRQIGGKNPMVADYNKAVATPTPFDPYIKEYKASPEAKMPGIYDAGSSTSGTVRDAVDARNWYDRKDQQSLDRANRFVAGISNRYDAVGTPLDGMKSTTPELVQKANERYNKAMDDYNTPVGYLPLLSPMFSRPMEVPIRSRAKPALPFAGREFYSSSNGGLAVGPPSLGDIVERLNTRQNERAAQADARKTALQQSQDVLARRAAGEMNPFVQGGYGTRALMNVAANTGIGGFLERRESADAQARAGRDAVVDYTKRNLGYSPQEIAADNAVRQAKRESGSGYWLDNLADTFRVRPTAFARLLNNPFEGVGRFFREQAARNRAARMGDPNRDDRLNTLEAIRSQERDRAAGEYKRQAMGGGLNPLSFIPIPGVNPPEDVVAGFIPTGRLTGAARLAVGFAPLLGSRVGLGATGVQMLTPTPGQTVGGYLRRNVAPPVAFGAALRGLEDENAPETIRRQADNVYTDRSQQVQRALSRLRASQASNQSTQNPPVSGQ